MTESAQTGRKKQTRPHKYTHEHIHTHILIFTHSVFILLYTQTISLFYSLSFFHNCIHTYKWNTYVKKSHTCNIYAHTCIDITSYIFIVYLLGLPLGRLCCGNISTAIYRAFTTPAQYIDLLSHTRAWCVLCGSCLFWSIYVGFIDAEWFLMYPQVQGRDTYTL